ncbi:MAG: EAL domain-containing protein [Gammaproteobacteria bacterium]
MGKQPAASVLAVDDNATIRKAISMRLGAKGFAVVTAAGGAEALELLGQQRFDLIILDLWMPDVGGDEVLRRVRQRYSATQLPVIMLAASNDKADINRTLELGANDYIVKPGDLPILIARIRTQLALKETVARLRENSALMRDMLAYAPRGTASAERVALRSATDALLARVDHGGNVPFDVLYDNTPMTCFTLTGDGLVVYANRFGARFLGYRAEELVERPMIDLYVREDRALAQENLAGAVDAPGRVYRWDIRHIKKGGDIVWMRNTARAIRHSSGLLVLVTCEDIDDTYKLSELLTYQAQHDDLTRLANRKALELRLAQVVDSARSEHTEHALAVLDIDQFKLVNDSCGHDAGDELLRQVAGLLKTAVRKRDTLARIGGDKFAILIEDSDAHDAEQAVEHVRSVIEDTVFEVQGHSFRLSASVGVVPIDDTCENANGALSMADTACYAAKESGRNRVHTFQPDNVPVVTRHGEMRWATRLNRALHEDRFELHGQPIEPLDPGLDGPHLEILVRMRGEDGTLILPGEFLPAAERYGLADKLDRWVIGRVFDWLEARPPAAGAIGMCSINLSGQSIGKREILDLVLARLARGLVSPEHICFEITETSAVADLVQANRFIHRLKDHGCRFALDDFGSGFSSLSYLKQLPVDFLKIDGAFVRDMVSDSIDLAMVRSINDIGHVMGKRTIAEFVENVPTLDLLRAIGVDYVQGYHVGRPAPLEPRSDDN